MVSEWRATTWGELATLEYGKSLKGYRHRKSGFRVYGTNGAIGWAENPLVNGPGIVIGRKGAYRGVHYSPTAFSVIDTAFYLCPKAELSLKWAYYQLLTQDINGMDSGSAIPSTSREAFYGLPVRVPPFPEQRAIAHILGTLDDKIELNRKMNETLEAMTRAIFKSWFIDFEPVKAKMQGRQPYGMDAETAALFPDSFKDSELGEIPKGWEILSLPEMVEINPNRSLTNGKVAPYLEMQNMPNNGHRPHDWVDRSFGSGMKFVNGDTLIARITPCLENGKTAYVDFLQEGEVGWGSTEYIIVRPKPPLPIEFGYFLARSEDFRNYAIQNMSGTSGRQRVPVDSLKHYSIVCPPELIAVYFGKLAEATLKSIKENDEQSRTLAALRDALLPKLISGELRIN